MKTPYDGGMKVCLNDPTVLTLFAHVCILDDGPVCYGTSLPQKVFCINMYTVCITQNSTVKISSKPENEWL